MDIKFLGATQTVTGTKHLLKGKSHNLLIDCGLYQGPDSDKHNKNIAEILSSEKIHAIVLTHAHLDHCGYIPKLYKDGFRGPIFCTPATYDIANIVMSDNARIQSMETKKANKNIHKEKNKLEPMYTQTEVNQALTNFKTIEFGEEFQWQEYTIKFKKAGHILGASSPIITTEGKRIQFSGDLGRDDDLVIHPPADPEAVETLVLESTYGDRLHLEENTSELFKNIFSQAKKKGSAIIIHAFSVGRSQTLMKILYDFFYSNPELNIPVFVDSPMTQAVTKLYHKYVNDHKISSRKLEKIEAKFHFIHYKSEKEKLDLMTDAHIILTAGGMMTGGNVLHHLAIKGENEDNYIFIAGFQSPDSLGYELEHGNLTHSLEDGSVNIKAKIIKLKSLSSHADHDGLIKWAQKANPKRIFITHGEEEAKERLYQDLKNKMDSEIMIPKLQEEFSI